jgi:cardiolipin synthase A/B
MLHQKYMVVDGLWSTVGTTNFDNRSFALNDENNVCVYDAGFAARWEQIFRKDLERCRRITLDEWRGRSLWLKTKEFFGSFLRDQV